MAVVAQRWNASDEAKCVACRYYRRSHTTTAAASEMTRGPVCARPENLVQWNEWVSGVPHNALPFCQNCNNGGECGYWEAVKAQTGRHECEEPTTTEVSTEGLTICRKCLYHEEVGYHKDPDTLRTSYHDMCNAPAAREFRFVDPVTGATVTPESPFCRCVNKGDACPHYEAIP